MNYQKIYDCLIQKRRKQKLTKYDEGEKHHVIPKSINSDLEYEPSNIVKLTYKEHFIAHRLLVKIYSYDNKLKTKMNYALWRMMHCNNTKKYISNSREFEMIRRDIIKNIKEHQKSLLKKPMSNETKQKISISCKGYKFTQEQKIISSLSKIGRKSPMKGKHQSDHAKSLISKAAKGNRYALGKIAINNGFIMKMVYPDKIPEGFKIGALKHKNKMSNNGRKNISKVVKDVRYCTNGIITKRIHKDEPLPEGFIFGNCKLKHRKNTTE